MKKKQGYTYLKNKYERIDVRINKELGLELKEKLQKNNQTIRGWIEEEARKYLKK